MCRAYLFSSNMTMVSHFITIINLIIVTDPTLVEFLKFSLSSLTIASLFVKNFFYHITTIFTFFDDTVNKTVNSIFASLCFK